MLLCQRTRLGASIWVKNELKLHRILMSTVGDKEKFEVKSFKYFFKTKILGSRYRFDKIVFFFQISARQYLRCLIKLRKQTLK